MISLKPSTHHNGFDTSFPYNSSKFQQNPIPIIRITKPNFSHTKTTFRTHAQPSGSGKGPQKRTFLTIEEAGLVEVSGLSTHERFLCRLTISSLNLLKVIAEEEKCSIEELNAGRLCDWFLKDKLKREQNLDSAVLQWDDSDPLF
ncbi:uncharacterized protein LOC101211873 [Cucumis sativus]|uniref:Receptor-interacting protein n=1 Tax=Cucumis sativus TaxID=3659 RepID=A0A0A0KHI4_CUCSA|nr:uncharacterized protein LOC101211873 [Cucumis sativus]KGN49180.1 hypothetical protein Csa_002941 [Cucumis sativus]